MSGGQIKTITSKKEYEDLVLNTYNSLAVVDFFAEWCGPCRQIAPVYKRLSKEFNKVIFATVDVDDHEDIAEDENVTAMPLFKFYKRGKLVDQVTGTNKDQLREKLERHQ